MRTPLNVPDEAKLRERTGIRSGPIERSGFTSRGVIFTFMQNPTTENKAHYSPTILHNARIENLDLPANVDDRFFTILGGYYMQRSQNAAGDLVVRTSQVFGICLNPAEGFDMTEGGERILVDEWRLAAVPDISGGNPTRDMDERIQRNSDDGGPLGDHENEGWTLIVEAKERRGQYPRSGGPMGIEIESPPPVSTCPKIEKISVTKKAPSRDSQVIQFTAEVTGPTPSRYIWDFNDGSHSVTTTQPVAEHTFLLPFLEPDTFEVRVQALGPGECEASGTEEVDVEPPERQFPESPGCMCTCRCLRRRIVWRRMLAWKWWMYGGSFPRRRSCCGCCFQHWADSRRADLRRADLRRADLRRADLRRADLRRADS